jgi:ABC-type oligopeptide transport system substrate-binding subunit
VSPAVPGFGRSGACPSCERPDAAKARDLAATAGLGPGAKVTFVTRKNSSATAGNDEIERQVESVLGWRITQRVLDVAQFEEFRKAMTGGDATGMGRLAWVGDYPSAYDFLHSVLGGGQSAGYSDWRDTRFDRLLSQAVATRDDADRDGLIRQAEKIALDDMALIPLWVMAQTRLVNTKKFTGLTTDYDGDPTLATAALK